MKSGMFVPERRVALGHQLIRCDLVAGRGSGKPVDRYLTYWTSGPTQALDILDVFECRVSNAIDEVSVIAGWTAIGDRSVTLGGRGLGHLMCPPDPIQT